MPAGIVGRKIVHDQLAITRNDREQVIEIVSHAASQHADRFHFLRLPQLFFEAASLGHGQ